MFFGKCVSSADVVKSSDTNSSWMSVLNLRGLPWTFIAVILLSCILPDCNTSCNIKPGGPDWREDGRCGPGFTLSTGEEARCHVDGDRPCCSNYGYCGSTPSHCNCEQCIDYRNVIQVPPCYFSYNGTDGYITSPDYPNEYKLGRDCCYDIERPSKEYCGVALLVESLDVGRNEEDGFCRKDWLTLPSCVPERGGRICGDKSGQYFQYLFQPGASAIRLQFHAGHLDEGRTGFKIKYDLLKICPGPYQTQAPPTSPIPGTQGAPCYTRITDSRGTINSPYFPQAYPGELDCVYEFVRTQPSVCGILMQTVKFSLEDPISTIFGGACADFFHLPSCGFLCGTLSFTWTVEFQPGATSLLFHFHSSESPSSNSNNLSTVVDGHQGFLINFQQVKTC